MKRKLALALIAAMTITSMTGCGNSKLALAGDEFTLELGDSPENHTASYVDVKDEKELNEIKFDFSKVNEMKVGDYTATASLGKTEKTFHIEVKDTTAPEAKAKKEIKAGVNVPVYAEDMIDSITELSGDVKVSFKDHAYTGEDPKDAEKADTADTKKADDTEAVSESTETKEKTSEKSTEESTEAKKTDSSVKETKTPTIERAAVSYDAAGEYDNVMTLTDASGNKTDVDVHIVVSNMPVINGATDMIAEKGAAIDFMNGVTAVDGAGNDITGSVSVDSSKVDVNTPGDYEVTYSVTDADGLTTTQTIKVTIAENVEETVNSTDTADGTASEKRVATSSGTGKATDKKNEMNAQHVAEQQAAAEQSAAAGNSGSQSGTKSQTSAGNGAAASGNSSSSVSSGSNGGGSSSSGSSQAQPQPQPEPQPSTPSQGPAVCDKGSATNGALTAEQKATVDAMVNEWRTSGGSDGDYSDRLFQYLADQGVDFSYGGCEHTDFLVHSWDEATARSRSTGDVYDYLYISTNGEYTSSGNLICYMWEVTIE